MSAAGFIATPLVEPTEPTVLVARAQLLSMDRVMLTGNGLETFQEEGAQVGSTG
jgi:hypothetical protein